ncbi:DUF2914 domain-containing protein [Gynuella sunshinyii]|uniref:DUF2914 domain-containing protein n=1 Tax=Gynuella sunshinyii YC6258 TaxID=1445510 RepID=A0A0C5VKG4_9GAMM|nr:DUF2914 domain-containing protein [Gynuella sunshinyii]AJQ95182.1 hypothetical Protein YC6258_03146 [Gynuella sunshinyii YC6258]
MSRFAITICLVILSFTAFAENGFVGRASVTSGIVDREPVDELNVVPLETDKLYFFTELMQFQGEQIRHIWKYKDEVMATVTFDVKGPRWRVYSSKNMLPEWVGDWTVEVLDQNDNLISSYQFSYGP